MFSLQVKDHLKFPLTPTIRLNEDGFLCLGTQVFVKMESSATLCSLCITASGSSDIGLILSTAVPICGTELNPGLGGQDTHDQD